MAAEGSGGGGGGRKTSSPHKTKERGAAKFLAGLPSHGNFSSSPISSNLGGLRVYVCEHDTDPPAGQVIETDTTNILIRHLQLKKKESEAKDSRTPGENGKGKRSAARSLDGQHSSKKPNLSTSGLPSSGWQPNKVPEAFRETPLARQRRLWAGTKQLESWRHTEQGISIIQFSTEAHFI
ncbi:hypothetical protein BRADI_4g19110v3 [Brachypodium distachyon]|uniref:DET1- and DDB1-associated protein 1 domain-containing protein n=1 Tax=Brachypodium distachyon TaxID=15368 RepID=A0A0Q3ELU4_BRADI|nr:hypothetical protein BRADI_4g19110v3 [Brachypodium distachyon]